MQKSWLSKKGMSLIFFSFILLLLTSCERSSAKKNIIFITLDTLRADHLPVYGYQKVETPSLDRFAQDAVVFQNANSHGPLTLPSHTSMMTGTYPFFHNVRNNGNHYASKALKTAAEILKSQDYDTAAFVSSFVLDSRFGLNQGFDFYDDDMIDGRQQHSIFEFKDRIAENTINRALNWLSRRSEQKSEVLNNFFLWVHLFDPHKEYDPPEPFKSKYLNNLYDGEIAYLDSQLSRLFNRLKALELYEDSLIIITGDHGESLGEHGESTHSIFIYNATTWVPMLIKFPGNQYKSQKVDRLVRHIDLLPTILDVISYQDSEEQKLAGDIQGISLIPIIENKKNINLVSYAESYLPKYYYKWSPPESIRNLDTKFIDLPKPELYDLNNDPHELNNIYQQEKQLADKLKKELVDLKEKLSQGKPREILRKMDTETIAKLKSLGYIRGGGNPSVSDQKKSNEKEFVGEDPKDVIYVQEEIQIIHALINRKEYDQAILRVKPMVVKHPKNLQLRNSLAAVYMKIGMIEEAKKEYNTLKFLDPTYETAYLGLAHIYLKKQIDYQKAEKELAGAFAINPDDPSLWVLKGDLQQDRNQLDAALMSYEKARKMGDQSASLFVGLGSLYHKQNRTKEARELLEKAIYIQNDNSEAHYNLGVVLVKLGEREQAYREYQTAISIDKSNPLFFTNLGSLQSELKQQDQAIASLKRALAIKPDHLEAVYNLGTVYLMQGKLDQAIPKLEKAIRLNPGMVFAYNNLVLAYSQSRQFKKAIHTYQRLTQVAPKRPIPWYRMAQLAMKINKKKDAQKYLQNALTFGGENVKKAAEQDPVLRKLLL